MRDLSSALAFVGRGSFFLTLMRAASKQSPLQASNRHVASNNNNNKQATNKHIAGSEARLVGFGDLKPGLIPQKRQGRAEKCAIFPTRPRLYPVRGLTEHRISYRGPVVETSPACGGVAVPELEAVAP